MEKALFHVALLVSKIFSQAEKKWGFDMRISLGRRPEAGLLAGLSVHVDPCVVSCLTAVVTFGYDAVIRGQQRFFGAELSCLEVKGSKTRDGDIAMFQLYSQTSAVVCLNEQSSSFRFSSSFIGFSTT